MRCFEIAPIDCRFEITAIDINQRVDNLGGMRSTDFANKYAVGAVIDPVDDAANKARLTIGEPRGAAIILPVTLAESLFAA